MSPTEAPPLAEGVAAVAGYLLDEMGDVVEGRVWRPEIPKVDDSLMSTSAIVVMRAGGYKLTGGTRLPIVDTLMDILCYGSTRQESETIANRAAYLLRELQMVQTREVLLYWARLTSGLNPRIHPVIDWTFTEFTVQVLHTQLTF